MHYSINLNPAPRRPWNRDAIRLLGLASLLLPILCQAQAPPVYTISTVAGAGPTEKGYVGDGSAAILAELNGPSSVSLDAKGNFYFVDQSNEVVRMVSGGTITTVVGDGQGGYAGDLGPATSATLSGPDTIFIDSKGNWWISDVLNNVIRMVTPAGVINTLAGNQGAGAGYGGDGLSATASTAQLNHPSGLVVDSAGNLYISDSDNFRIRMVTPAGIISTYAGNGVQGFYNGGGAATAAHLNYPRGLALDSAGDLYIADSANNQIRKVTPVGVISLFAGDPNGNAGYGGDGSQAVGALLNYPTGVAVDSAGNVYIADDQNNVIRMVTPNGVIHTIAGMAITQSTLPGYSGDGGPALSALFNEPSSVTVDSAGNLYVADYANLVVRLLTPSSAPGGKGPAPAIRTAGNPGVQSASDFGAIPTVAPGSWIEIYGTNLAPDTRSWGTGDFNGINAPTSLDGTTVSIGGYSAFVDYISPTQVNAQVPGTIGLGPLSVTVNTPAGTSNAYTVTAKLQQPGLYAPLVFRIVGQQYVGALFTDNKTYVFPTGSFAGIPSRPALPGETIVIYGIGFGAVPGNPPGQISQAANGLTLPLAPKFYFAGVQAQVQFAGLVSGDVGLYQFNVIVPNIPANNAVPLTFTVNINGTDVPGTQTLYTAVQ